MTIINVTNTGDIKVLRETVKSLNNALGSARRNAKMLEQQRDSQIIEATAFANAARTLCKKLGLSNNDLKELRLECQKICEEDYKKRGVKDFAANPPKFTLKNWR